jgi:peptide-methionine (R)-S-oxide reductase
MDRRTFLTRVAPLIAAPVALTACGRSESKPPTTQQGAAASDSTRYTAPLSSAQIELVHSFGGSVSPIDTPDDAWKDRLSDDAYYILFEDGTERAGTSPLLQEKRRGTFLCLACHLPLFPSTTKYDSGTGWPSFWAPIPGHVATRADRSLGVVRTEYHCPRCSGHHGHVFHDGPDPTGLRYCNNGDSLRFIPESEPLPDLRA